MRASDPVGSDTPRGAELLEDLADQPHMTERVLERALKHALDGTWTNRRMKMFDHGISFDCSRRHCLPVRSDWIVDEQLDPDGGEPGRELVRASSKLSVLISRLTGC
jgi:hypothetical protein